MVLLYIDMSDVSGKQLGMLGCMTRRKSHVYAGTQILHALSVRDLQQIPRNPYDICENIKRLATEPHPNFDTGDSVQN